MPDQYDYENVQGLPANELVSLLNNRLEVYPSVEFFKNDQGQLIMRTWKMARFRDSDRTG